MIIAIRKKGKKFCIKVSIPQATPTFVMRTMEKLTPRKFLKIAISWSNLLATKNLEKKSTTNKKNAPKNKTAIFLDFFKKALLIKVPFRIFLGT